MKQALAGIAVVVAVLALGVLVMLRGAARDPAAATPGASSSSAAVLTISRGEAVRIEDHLGSGLTVVEFYADW